MKIEGRGDVVCFGLRMPRTRIKTRCENEIAFPLPTASRGGKKCVGGQGSIAMDNAEFRLLAAMFKAGLKRKAKLSPAAHAQRVAVECELQAARYCDAFALWRRCRLKRCRRRRACDGDAHACLKRTLDRVPQSRQAQARQTILDATPHNIGAPERQARQRMPRDLYE
jgi:hypothetical protein